LSVTTKTAALSSLLFLIGERTKPDQETQRLCKEALNILGEIEACMIQPPSNMVVEDGHMDGLDECPYIIGVQCNQRKRLCDQGRFEASCVMLALRQIDHAIESDHEYFINEGILRACHVLLHKDFLKGKYQHHCSSSLKDLVLEILAEAKKNGYDWHEVGWEFLEK